MAGPGAVRASHARYDFRLEGRLVSAGFAPLWKTCVAAANLGRELGCPKIMVDGRPAGDQSLRLA